jgi:glycosyltransferase involved in cell wall biosynthesis
MSAKKMTTSCVINNYNYAEYLVQAVKSALNQTVKFDEIIIVDDASTDNSAEIASKFAEEANVKCILKEKNQGQLSSFNEGFLAATGDLVFFLDADDMYESHYLENALNFYKRHRECDFLICAYKKFGSVEGTFQADTVDLDLGYSVLRTFCLGEWIGSITSTLSMRREVLEKFLPIPSVEDWRVRADDCLVWGSSLVGAKKFYMSQPSVMYRIHSNNQYYNQKSLEVDYNYEYKRFLKCNSLFNYITQKNNFSLPLSLTLTSLNEFKTIPCPEFNDFIVYLKIIFLFERNLYSQVKGIMFLLNKLLKLYVMGKLKSPSAIIQKARLV